MPYLLGFFGINVMKGQCDFKSINCSSTVSETYYLYFHCKTQIRVNRSAPMHLRFILSSNFLYFKKAVNLPCDIVSENISFIIKKMKWLFWPYSPVGYWREINDFSSHMLTPEWFSPAVSFFVGVFRNWAKNLFLAWSVSMDCRNSISCIFRDSCRCTSGSSEKHCVLCFFLPMMIKNTSMLLCFYHKQQSLQSTHYENFLYMHQLL